MSIYFSSRSIETQYKASRWEDAVRRSGELLLADGRIHETYIDGMIEMIKENGAYMLLAPGLCIPHARPESGCIQNGISYLHLHTPVVFPGKEDNPVCLLIALAAQSNQGHLDLLTALFKMIDEDETFHAMKNPQSKEWVLALLESRLP